MYRIAIVEDDEHAAALLTSFLNRYAEEKQEEFSIRCYAHPVLLLEGYTADVDIVFMDIQMPCMNGMEAAHRLRELDEQVVLVFVTNLTQYAIEGYAVNAQDYIVKPFNYYEFALKFKRTLSRVPHRETPSLLIRSDGQTIRLELRDLHYVEVQGHLLLYHTATQTYRQFGSLGELEKQIAPYHFARCNSCYLVNLHFVRSVYGFTAELTSGETLTISRTKKKSFSDALSRMAEKTRQTAADGQ